MSFPTFRAAVLGLALAAAPGLASTGAAQGRSAADVRTVEGYRLTMPVLQKVLPALYAPGAQGCPQERDRDPRSLGLAEMARLLERCGPIVQALKRAGVPTRDAAIVLASVYRTSEEVALRGGKASAVPPGVLRDNALLLQRPEIRRITEGGSRS
jgi:hypothetical protein